MKAARYNQLARYQRNTSIFASETPMKCPLSETLSLGAACDHSNGPFKKTFERPPSTASAWLVLFWASQNKQYTSTAGLDRITWILCLLDFLGIRTIKNKNVKNTPIWIFTAQF
jgi:hypothetical protein